jgi:hypothetical protein
MMGVAYVNIKYVPNGLYTIYLIRISEPLTINSRLNIVSKVEDVNINIDRNLLSKTLNNIRKEPLKVTNEMLKEKMSCISEE